MNTTTCRLPSFIPQKSQQMWDEERDVVPRTLHAAPRKSADSGLLLLLRPRRERSQSLFYLLRRAGRLHHLFLDYNPPHLLHLRNHDLQPCLLSLLRLRVQALNQMMSFRSILENMSLNSTLAQEKPDTPPPPPRRSINLRSRQGLSTISERDSVAGLLRFQQILPQFPSSPPQARPPPPPPPPECYLDSIFGH